ncbi:DUF6067 family protein [Flavobacteriaceae bacterium F89]|uniref:DUF6067 family protein n=1 Tax=Cerina litoralis TaxID=2874477 RepID=A0AAE3JQV4_9FLAO|nr:glycoside hydrolase domain-containing protein [Cerina litoralis]MCG2462284.1 DUF6067 family protein [Cerina litoralis]
MIFKESLCTPKLLGLFLLLFAVTISGNLRAQKHIYPPEKPLWDADSLGNQRAVVLVHKNVPMVTVSIDWRNRNVATDQLIYVVDSTQNKMVGKANTFALGPEQGIVQFDASSGPGIYYVYYLPYSLGGRSRSYPDAIYKTVQKSTSNVPSKNIKPSSSKIASVIRFESADSFNSNDPMEIISTKKELAEFQQKYKDSEYFVFPEKRDIPIKMIKYLPKKWLENEFLQKFTDTAKRGENFTFQLGVWANSKDLNNVSLSFTDLSDDNGNSIKTSLFNCLNLEGVDYTGKPFTKTVNIPKGSVQPLWCGLQIPKTIQAGTYRGSVTFSAKNTKSTTIPLVLNITDELAVNHGIDKPWKQTRLQWLNSTMAQENTVIDPYIPLKISGNTVSLLGRNMIIAPNGLPQQIQTFFTEEMTSISHRSKDILSSPFAFRFLDNSGKEINMEASGYHFQKKEPGTVTWEASSISPQMQMIVTGALEFDGFAHFEVQVTAKQDLELSDIGLQVPMHKTASKYMLGLGHKGGKRPGKVDWKWDVAHKNQDGVWLGDVNAGLQLGLRDQNYERPLNTNFYLLKPLILPTSWGNENKGGIKISEEGDTILLDNYSGSRTMKKGDTLFYNFTLLITPFHSLETDSHWAGRYFHAYQPIDSVLASGANIVNIHHANELNPYINYPFIATKEMKTYIDAAHEAGLKVKIYNTIREVSNRMYELFPVRSLGNEVFSSGKGGGYSWLQEHLQDDYIAAWYVPKFKDAAIINSGMNRWHNYYVEGMNWLVQNIGIDGIYLDDVAFDRVTMKRIKRVLTQDGHPGIIDLHSANQFNKNDGFNNSAYLYMEHFPYLNRLWFGEYFDYEAESPEFFLTEVSGIPFGLMGEMLQDGGNPWRGMIYGMTNRMPYQKEKPDKIWKVWDDFGMVGSQMIGYWVDDCPVSTDNGKVLATVYQKEGRTLVSLASWAEEDTQAKLNIDWKKLGLDPKQATITAPEVKNFQPAATFRLDEEIPVKKNQGWLIIIE